MKQSDKQRLAKIIDYGDKLAKYIETEHIGRNELLNDYTAQWTVTTPLYNIGEHVYQLSDELKDSNTKIPWSMISGMRHRLVHDYDGTNWSIIVEVIFDDLPKFILDVKRIYTTMK
ncbi:putative uncharacterized protein [Firmicutes bacterium CAG:238]|nr:putative uncharacterized protein [Firmicutes bacterium CAG:238]